MFRRSSHTMPLVLFQAVCGLLAGLFLGIATRVIPNIVTNIEQYSASGIGVMVIALFAFIAIPLHFIINANIRAFADEKLLVAFFGPQPSKTKTKIARVMFWICLGLGLFVGITAQISFYFGPF